MAEQRKHLKFSGKVPPQDTRHQVTTASSANQAPDEHYLAPTTVTVNVVQPPNHAPIGVPKYGDTVNGGSPAGFDPAGDCNGNYMSYKFQPNNNCYAYGCNITPNSFPQPGRAHGYLLSAADFTQPFDALGKLVANYAVKDGLQYAGRTWDDLMKFKSSKQGTNPNPGGGEAEKLGAGFLGGHFVALMISPAGDANWPGDYHWARCDNSSGGCNSWSQKDGNDQVTNFDFAGQPITDPAKANWTVNQGPVEATPGSPPPPDVGQDQVVEYSFYCYMFVPNSGVDIL